MKPESHTLNVRTRRDSDRKDADCSCGQWHMRNALIADIRKSHGVPAPLTDEQILMKHDRAVRPRARMELKIVNQFLADAERAGRTLRIQEMERDIPGPSVRDDLFDLDDAHVLVHDATGRVLGWVYFVFGNDGYDCISDYTLGLEEFLQPCLALSERLADGLDA